MQTASPSRAAPALLVLAVVVVGLLAGSGVALLASRHPAGTPRAAVPVPARALLAPRPEVRAAQLLGRWDRARSDAWARGDPVALRALYVDGSSAADRDVAMLAAWARRGLRVEGMRTQVVRLRVLVHRPGRYEIELVDRVVGGEVVGPVGRGPLPLDEPSLRRVVLVDTGGAGRGVDWRVAEVSAVTSAGVSAGATPEVSAVPSPAGS